MNKYREQIDLLFNELAATDVEIDESLKLMDEIDGRIEQLNNAPGAVRAREVATEEAERAVEDMRKLQEKRAGIQQAREGASLKELGLHTMEELEQMKQELVIDPDWERVIDEDRDTEEQYN